MGIDIGDSWNTKRPSVTLGEGAIVSGNSGRGVVVDNAYFRMNDGSEISYNMGGGVSVYDQITSFIMEGGTISHNTAQEGGGIYSYRGRCTMNGGSISGNTATNSGGGIYNSNGAELTVTGGSIEGCTTSSTDADTGGGGILAYGGNSDLTIEDTEISGNTAASGAGIYGAGGTITLKSGAKVINNIGSGIYATNYDSNHSTTLIMENGDISGNTNAAEGGGVLVNNGSTFTMNGGTISGNAAASSKGVHTDTAGTFTQNGGTVQSD